MAVAFKSVQIPSTQVWTPSAEGITCRIFGETCSAPISRTLLAADNDDVPHLSLEERWQDGQFSIPAVLGGYSREVNVRAWTLQLLQRYRFVVGMYIFQRLDECMF